MYKIHIHIHVVKLAASTINTYVRDGKVGQEPAKRGYEGILSKDAFKLLVFAVESYIQINQVNCIPLKRNILISIINEVCAIVSNPNVKMKDNMFERVMQNTTVSLHAAVSVAVEERRILWTTYDNLHIWFTNWKAFLIKYEFCNYDKDTDTASFTPEQLRRIFNVDETEISLDGSKTSAGGRPSVTYS